ncbi:MAG: KOW domain-containing RNA-binding protein [Clostridia bacterium]|nr:KOW domain-containing RNA-binding protein [Clostridia bacterium]
MKVKVPQTGGVVRSVRGRDDGRYYVIAEVLSGGFVLVVDGKTRTLENPKKKNAKHLRLLPYNLSEAGIVRDKSFDVSTARYLKELAEKS